jgi:hypothetical protein
VIRSIIGKCTEWHLVAKTGVEVLRVIITTATTADTKRIARASLDGKVERTGFRKRGFCGPGGPLPAAIVTQRSGSHRPVQAARAD